jgi:hypothetical protein
VVGHDSTTIDALRYEYRIEKGLSNRKFLLKILKTGKSETDRVEYKRRAPACSRQSQTTRNERVGGMRVQYVVSVRYISQRLRRRHGPGAVDSRNALWSRIMTVMNPYNPLQ